MWLIICEANDRPALWAGQQLHRIGLSVHWLTPQELLLAKCLQYQTQTAGPPHGYAELLADRVIATSQVRGTLNRAVRQTAPQLRFAHEQDQHYVQAEMDAIVLAWLATLPAPIINAPTACAWSGVNLSAFAWAMHAQVAGFTTLPYRCGQGGLEFPSLASANVSSHLVFAGQIFPPLAAALTEAALALAQRVNVALLGITLAWDGSPMNTQDAVFIEATSLPDLRIGGSAFVEALAQALQPATPRR